MKIKLSELKQIIQEEMNSIKEVHRSEFPDRDADVRHDRDVVVDYPDDPGPDADDVTLTSNELEMLAYEVDINEDEVYDRFDFEENWEDYVDDDGYVVRGREIRMLVAIDNKTGKHYLADEDGDWSRLPE